MPEMIVSFDSGSRCTRNVGSSRWKRFSDFEKFGVSFPTGLIAREITGSGTNIEVCCEMRLEVKYHGISATTIGKGVPTRAFHTKHSTNFTATGFFDFL